MVMNSPIKLLFLCTGNSCRSQMAEGLCRQFRGDLIEPFSAGIETHGLNPLAVKVMAEIGIDIANQKSKTTEDLQGQVFDYVVTVCGHANETCPWFPAETGVLHRGFDDPPKLAEGAATEEQALVHYRRVRDEIKDYILTLPESLG
jgi:arsenate reductase